MQISSRLIKRFFSVTQIHIFIQYNNLHHPHCIALILKTMQYSSHLFADVNIISAQTIKVLDCIRIKTIYMLYILKTNTEPINIPSNKTKETKCCHKENNKVPQLITSIRLNNIRLYYFVWQWNRYILPQSSPT